MDFNDTDQLNAAHNANSTHTAVTDVHDRWWLPLAIALPVCLVGIVLVTILVLVVITCHRSKAKHKQKNSESCGKLNDAVGNHNDSTDTGIFATPYANMDETIREAKLRPLVLAHSNGSKGGSDGVAKTVWNRTPSSTSNESPNKTNAFSLVENDAEKKKEEEEEKNEGVGKRSFGKTVAELDSGKAAKDKGAGVILNAATPGGQSINGHGREAQDSQPQVGMKSRRPQKTEGIGEEQVETPGKPADNRKTFVVMYSLESKDEGRLPLSVNDVIFYLEEEKDGWMKGEKKESGEVGWFPRSHVREGMSPLAKRHSLPSKLEGSELKEVKLPIDFIKPTNSAIATTTTKGVISKANDQYNNDTDEDFDDDDNDEDDDYETGIEYEAVYAYRALEEGDLNFDAGDVIVVVEKHENGWWRGYRGDEQGFFPGSYVQLKSFEEKTSIDKDVHLKDGEFSSPTEDISRSVTELLPISAIDEEAEDDDGVGGVGGEGGGGGGSVSDEKKRRKKRRSSLGLFLLSLPRKMNAAKTNSLSNDSPDSPTTEKIKKTDNKTVKKKKKKKTTTTKGANPSPFVRRSSLAPAPPSDEQQARGVVRKNGAKTDSPPQHNNRDTTYEELNGWSLDSTVPEPSLVESINSELKTRGNTDKLRPNLSIEDDAASRETKLDSQTVLNKTTTTAAAAAVVRPVSTSVAAAGVLLKPVPPRKPNFSGSTPNMAPSLLDSDEYKAVLEKRNFPEKPKLMAKPRVVVSENLPRELKNGGVGHPFKEPGSEPPKPTYLRPGFPTGRGGSPGRQAEAPVPRELCRSLDSVVFPGTDEEEEEEELEIVKWLQRKLSEEDALDAKSRDETTTVDKSTISTNAEEFRRKSPNGKPEIFGETNHRISFMIEDIFKCGLHEESYA